MTSARFLADLPPASGQGRQGARSKLLLDQLGLSARPAGNVARPDPAAFAEVDKAVAALRRRRAARRPGRLDHRREDALPQQAAAQAAGRSARRARTRLGLNEAGNNEVLFAWLELAVANRYDPAVPALERFLLCRAGASSSGR